MESDIFDFIQSMVDNESERLINLDNFISIFTHFYVNRSFTRTWTSGSYESVAV